MSKKYLDTSFSDFIRHKLYERANAEHDEPQTDEEAPEDSDNTELEAPAQDEQPQEESEIEKSKNKQHKVGSKEYMDDMIREFEEIINGYDNLHRNKHRR
jgi:hypothetical protein